MIRIAQRMLVFQRARVVATTLGLGFLFFLSATQVGVFVGWCDTTQRLIRQAGVDIWVMAEHTSALEYGSPIPRHRVEQVRNVPGVTWAEALHFSSSVWRRADGCCTTVFVIGLDRSCAGGPSSLQEGRHEDVFLPQGVIVDEFYLDRLGIHGLSDEAQLFGKRAVVHGISRGVRTFASTPCIFTSLTTARRYDARYEDDEVTFVLARTSPGSDPEAVARAIAAQVPAVEVLTTPQFARRTTGYWMLRTGAGVTVILTSLLGLVVGAVVAGQTLFTITQDNLENYGTLLAVGFSRSKMLSCVLLQGLLLSAGGIALGGPPLAAACLVSTRTPVPVHVTPLVFMVLAAISVLGSLLGAYFSIRSVLKLEPVMVFRG